MKIRLAGSLLMLALALGGAGAQQSAQPDPLSKYDLQTRRQIQGMIDSARLENLPSDALRLKAIEALAKKVKTKDVMEGLRRYYKALEQSRAALGPLASPEEIETGASVLWAGVSTDDLAKFRVTSASRSPMRPLTYLADLIDKQNVPRNDAIEAFSKLWKDGAADADFDGLWHLVDQDILSGVPPRNALQSRMRSLPPRANKPPGDQQMENPRS
jgi:hypothetical protein